MALLDVTDNSFRKEILESPLPVVVDFWAPWCAPCRMIAPLIDEVAADYSPRLKFAKINIDENPKTAADYGVMSIPTLMFFKDAKVVAQAVGVLSRAELKKKIEQLLR